MTVDINWNAIRQDIRGLAAVSRGVITQDATDQIFSQNGSKIQRLNDRVMIGAAGESDFAFPNVTQDWLSAYQVAAGLSNGTLLNTQSAVLVSASADAAVGFVGGSRTANLTSAGSACIGVMGVAVANNASVAADAWALYSEAHRDATSTSLIYAYEGNVRTMRTAQAAHPWLQGEVVGIQVAAGAGLSAVGQFDASCAIQIVANPMQFKKGIVFGHDSLDGSTGGVGESCAIGMAITQNLEWFNSAGARTGVIKFTTTSTANRTGVISNDSGFFVVGESEQPLLLIANLASAVNYPQLVSATTGNDVQVFATGSDTNRSLRLRGAGTGTIYSHESFWSQKNTAIPAGGSAGKGLLFSTTANFGIFFGSGVPSLSAAQGSIYMRSDGSSTSTRAYINTNGTTGWTAITTAT